MANSLGNLKVGIGVDDSALTAGLKEATADIQQFADKVSNTLNSALINTESLLESFSELKPFSPHIEGALKAATNVGQLKDVLLQLKAEAAQATTTNEWTAYQRAIQGVEGEIKRVNGLLNETAPATKGATTAIKDATQSTSQLTTILGGASKGFSFLRQAAYLIPGIGIAGIFNLAAEGVMKLVDATGLFNDKAQQEGATLDQLRDKVGGYAKALAAANDYAGDQLAKVTELVAVLNLSNEPLKVKEKALQDLQAINANYFESLRIEDGLVNGLSAAYLAYAENIFRVAKAKAAQKEIEILAQSVVGLTEKLNNVNEKLLTLSNKQTFLGADNAKKSFEELNNILKKDFLTFDEIKRVQELTGKDERTVSTLIQERVGLRTEELSLMGRMQQLSELVARNDLKGVVGATATKEELNKVDEALKKLQADLLAISLNIDNKDLIQIDEDKIKAIGSTIRRLLELGLSEGSSQVQGLKALAEDLQFEILPAQIKKSLDEMGRKLSKQLAVVPPIEIKELPVAVTSISEVQARAAIENMREVLQRAGKQVFTNQGILTDVKLLNDNEVKKNFDNLTKDIQKQANVYKSLAHSIAGVFDSVFEGLITKGKISIADISKAIGNLIIKLIEAVAEAAILAAILSATGLGGLVGATGKGFNSVFKAVYAHADGGVFTGPTLIGNHLFGEAGPEALMPLDRLQGLLADNSSRALRVEGTITSSPNQFSVIMRNSNTYTQRNWGATG